ncbi:activator of 90 kDa heat shock protein ATPase homolog 1-like [Diprion similis]|uniref:activator of 90 kDa heat shock protein ATPase homolog 1-like n=1 Tax=Diprion similis TaxID=362088 RepID=UPI001EF7D55A|nr:activator of 90 kDa heat shock protein ATPase homolog 1-like [Diprion similis]
MAKWGEGDPRWIVEERPDATNVNNWHWTEKNACQWSQDKLKELFVNLVIQGDNVKCKVTEFEKCEGEAVANNRKGKLIFFYEWNLVLKWVLEDSGEEAIAGKINIPNLSEENDVSEVDIEITLKDSTDKGEAVKHFLHTKGKDTIREKLVQYVSSLKEGKNFEYLYIFVVLYQNGDQKLISEKHSSSSSSSSYYKTSSKSSTQHSSHPT